MRPLRLHGQCAGVKYNGVFAPANRNIYRRGAILWNYDNAAVHRDFGRRKRDAISFCILIQNAFIHFQRAGTRTDMLYVEFQHGPFAAAHPQLVDFPLHGCRV